MTQAPPSVGPTVRLRGVFTDAGHLFALCGFAIAQPLFDLLGNNPTFFVAHDLEGSALVVFALAVVLVPPLALFAVLMVARLASAVVARVLRAAMAGTLAAMTLLPPLIRTVELSGALWIVLAVILSALLAVAYDRLRALRTFVTYLTPAPVLFLVILLFVSPANVLVTSNDPAAAKIGRRGPHPPIVMIVFDEFPLGGLLDQTGQIDAARFPGFARLAADSTWYRKAATVALYTHQAVPAIASGIFPTRITVPVAANYPHSLFTLLATTHHLHVTETVTRLCPKDFCHHRTAAAPPKPHLADDVETVFLHTLLSDQVATDWGVPEINDRWAGFGETTPTKPGPVAKPDAGLSEDEQIKIFLHQDKVSSVAAFLDSLGTGARPGLWFLHSLLPHEPYTLLPGGQLYTQAMPGLSPNLVFANDPNLVAVVAQRFILQTMVVDQLVSRLLDRLKATHLFKKSMVVVTADHGAVFEPGKHFRAFTSPGVDAKNKNEILPVPLFVKYPGQTTGKIDDRPARTIDVVPTIADALRVQVPKDWHFDGRSLLAKPPRTRPYRVVEDGEHDADTIHGPVDARVMARTLRRYLGPSGGPHDGFRVGPFGGLVGQAAAPLVRGSPTGRVHADDWSAYDHIDLRGEVPALFKAEVSGPDSGEWIAVELNGTIAGVGPVYRFGNTRAEAMLDPSLMHAGSNQINVYEISRFGTLRLLRPRH